MVKACCAKVGLKKGKWSAEEDQILVSYIQSFGHENWRTLPKQAGLLRCGKSCRFRWLNYLSPDIKRGNYTKQEEEIIISLHKRLGNRWSIMAKSLPGRTDNEIKNYWYTHLKKRNNQGMAETNQPSVENSTCSTNKGEAFQMIPQSTISQYSGPGLVFPMSFSNNLALKDGSWAMNSIEWNGGVSDQFMQLESSYEFGSSVIPQSQSAELITLKECSSSTFEDPFLRFPLSPLPFGGYDYMAVHYNTEIDVFSQQF